MTFANQHWFDLPGAEPTAAGDSLKNSFLPLSAQQLPDGGILHPKRKALQPGCRLVRFGDVGTVLFTVRGEWWMEFSEYAKVETFATKARLSIPDAIRQFCCVPSEWNTLSIVIQARVTAPLLVYSGESAPAWGKADRKAPPPFNGAAGAVVGFEQLFIPGMGSADLRRDSILIEGYGNLPPTK